MVGIGVGYSQSESGNESKQYVWKPQAKALESMYGRTKSLYDSQQWLNNQFQNFGMNVVNPYMASLNPYMMQGFGGLMGGGQQGQMAQQMNPALQESLQQSLGPQGPTNRQKMYQDIIGGEGNSYIDPVINDMYDNAWQGLDRGAFKNSAQSAAQSGNMGNYSRQIDNSLMASETMSDVRTKANQLRAGAYNDDMNWKMNIAGMADDNAMKERMGAQQSLMGLNSAADQNTAGALGQGQMMQQMGMGMMNPYLTMMQAPWMGMNNYANILGDPTVMNYSTGHSSAYGGDVSVGV